MTKANHEDDLSLYEMAEAIVNSPAWHGSTRDPWKLAERYSWEYLHDIYTEVLEAEEEFYDCMYGAYGRDNALRARQWYYDWGNN